MVTNSAVEMRNQRCKTDNHQNSQELLTADVLTLVCRQMWKEQNGANGVARIMLINRTAEKAAGLCFCTNTLTIKIEKSILINRSKPLICASKLPANQGQPEEALALAQEISNQYTQSLLSAVTFHVVRAKKKISKLRITQFAPGSTHHLEFYVGVIIDRLRHMTDRLALAHVRDQFSEFAWRSYSLMSPMPSLAPLFSLHEGTLTRLQITTTCLAQLQLNSGIRLRELSVVGRFVELITAVSSIQIIFTERLEFVSLGSLSGGQQSCSLEFSPIDMLVVLTALRAKQFNLVHETHSAEQEHESLFAFISASFASSVMYPLIKTFKFNGHNSLDLDLAKFSVTREQLLAVFPNLDQ
uniref:Uncharacterized protein n=1 Tax=Plectus sambesii TaxID=2011161 RepID=A0A914VWH5_9BILA